jgi:hypothetical protein
MVWFNGGWIRPVRAQTRDEHLTESNEGIFIIRFDDAKGERNVEKIED